MQTENDTTKPEDSPEQEDGEGCSGAPCYALHWRYWDNSAAGVVPHLFTEAEKAVVSQVFAEIEPCKDVEWIPLHNA
jgi:hypothetical protein